MSREILCKVGNPVVPARDIHREEGSTLVRSSATYVKVSWDSVLKGKGYLPGPVALFEYPYQCLGHVGEQVVLVVAKKGLVYDALVLKAKSGSLLAFIWDGYAWGPFTEKFEMKMTLISSCSDIHCEEPDGDICMKTSCFQRVHA